jgi:beta-lactamase class A
MLDRRTLMAALAASPALLPALARGAPAEDSLSLRINALEKRSGGRLGVAVLDTQDGRRFAARGDERFLMCSTFKLLLTGLVLRRVDQKRERLDRRVQYGPEVLVDYSPETKKHVGPGMTIANLCQAVITLSDNTAANLLLDAVDGPVSVTRFARALGDTVTRLDRIEPSLNTAATPDDPRDTTSPNAMLETMRTLTVGDALTTDSRARLVDWLIANRTGDARLRAGLPKTWKIGDKTGSDGLHTTNDIAVVWPPGRAPLLITTYLTGAKLDNDGRNAVLASVARAVVAAGFGA